MDLLVKHYTQALHNFAKQKNLLDQAAVDMAHLNTLIHETKAFYTFLKSPLISKSEMKDIINFLKEKLNLSTVIVKFLDFLYFQKRLKILKKICETFALIYEKTMRKMTVYLMTANEISLEYRTNLISLLQKKLKRTILLKEKIIPDLVGGMILKINGYQIDFSLKGQLNQLAKEMRG